MIKTFENRQTAETDLAAHGFKLISTGRYVNAHCVASIHPVPGNDAVRVGYSERAVYIPSRDDNAAYRRDMIDAGRGHLLR